MVEAAEWVNYAMDVISSVVDDVNCGNPTNLGREEESQDQERH